MNQSVSEDIPVFPKAGTIMVHSGNIVNWNRLKRKPNQNSTEELKECIGASLNKFISLTDKQELQYVTDMVCVNSDFKETLSLDERGDLKITVKLFFCVTQPLDVISEAVERALEELNITFLETLLVSFPEDDLPIDDIKPYWEVLESLVQQEKVISLGVCDLDAVRLKELFDWAMVKPCINQVNLASCCVMPKELTEFAKENDIQLLTHSDLPEIMPEETLQEALKLNSTSKDSLAWNPQWSLRYSVIIKCRGIIKTKGYIFKATRDIKKRP